tara:strand:+ start:939 stop:1244 length:306 start_codon:yes stop_codon:yes gene_type:complete
MMSELDLAVEQEVEANPTLDLVNALGVGDFNNAETLFKDILGSKVQDTLDAEKVSVADQMFNGIEPEQLELSDEEVDAAFDQESEAEFEQEEISTESEESE